MHKSRLITAVMGGSSKNYQWKVKNTQPANLIGYWPCNGDATDKSGNGFHGTPNAGVTWGAGIGDGGQAAVFAGAGYINLISAGLAAKFSGLAGTLFSWWEVSAAGDWADAAYRNVTRFSVDDNNLVVQQKRSTANQFANNYTGSGTAKSLNNAMNPANPTGWCYSAVTWNKAADKVIIYITGTAPTTRTAVPDFVGTLTRALIGADTTALGQPWKGSIAHVALWDTDLTGAQITSLTTYTPPF